jgi:starch synthase
MNNTFSPQQKPQNILFAASEVFPFSKSGGLSKVVSDLSHELAAQGNKVVVVTPWYADLEEQLQKQNLSLGETKDVSFPFNQTRETVTIGQIEKDNVTYVFVKHEDFQRDKMYGYEDDAKRFARFCRAIPEVSKEINFTPDVIHAHDWQTGMLPLVLEKSDQSLLPQGLRNIPTVFTIHRGEFFGEMVDPETMVSWLRLPRDTAKNTHLEYHGKANPVWAAVGSANHVTTVSPTYATELTDEHGYLSMNYHLFADKISGVLNGIDTDIWNPQTSPYLNAHFSTDDLSNKQKIKEDLCEKFGLEDSTKPTLCVISRISQEKGMDITIDAIDGLIEQGWNIIIGGSGDPELTDAIEKKAAQYKGQMVYKNGWIDAQESHCIFAGSDATLIPSKSEPCGLTQMEAQAYGTLPIARNTGGLADTIEHNKTGFLFDDYSSDALLRATQEAVTTYNSQNWQELQKNAMKEDHSWVQSAQQYQAIYQEIIEKNKSTAIKRAA